MEVSKESIEHTHASDINFIFFAILKYKRIYDCLATPKRFSSLPYGNYNVCLGIEKRRFYVNICSNDTFVRFSTNKKKKNKKTFRIQKDCSFIFLFHSFSPSIGHGFFSLSF